MLYFYCEKVERNAVMNNYDGIEILSEISITETKYVFDLILENGVLLHVKEDGSADGEDGNPYFCVSRLTNGEIEVLGWSKDIDKPLHL